MCKVLGFKVFMNDGSILSSKDRTWEEIPDDGLVAVLVYEDEKKPNGDHMVSRFIGYDYYFRADGELDYIFGCINDRREDNTPKDIEARYVNPIIKRGIWVDSIKFKQIQQSFYEEANRKWQ